MKIRFSKTLMSVAIAMSALVFASCGKNPPAHEHTIGEHGICETCHQYCGEEKTLNNLFDINVKKDKKAFARVQLTSDTHYGLWATINPLADNEGYVDAYIKPVGSDTFNRLVTAEHDDLHLLKAEDYGTYHDGYVYLECWYNGNAEEMTFEDLAIKTFPECPGIDDNCWWYGHTVTDFSEEFDLEEDTYKINGKLAFGIAVSSPEETKFKVQITGLLEGDTVSVYQDNGSKKLVHPQVVDGWYIPASAEDMIVVVNTSVTGSTLDVSVTEEVIGWSGELG